MLSSTAGTTRHRRRRAARQGIKVGLLKPRVFRPFPAEELVDALSHVKVVGVMDRSIAFGAMGNAGPLFLELLAAQRIYGGNMPMVDYIFGLGGRDIVPPEIEGVYNDLLQDRGDGQDRATW